MAILLVFFGSKSAALAFRGDDTPGAKTPSTGAVRPPPAAAISPNRAALASIANSNLTVEWHPQSGRPTSVRGSDLAAPRGAAGGLQVRAGTNVAQGAFVVLENLKPLYGIRNATNEFAVTRQDQDSIGFRHVRMAQRHRGLPVIGGEMIVHFNKRSEAYQVSGQYVPGVELETNPKLTDAGAIDSAQAHLLKSMQGRGTLSARPRLVVYARDAVPQLAYEFSLDTTNRTDAPARWKFFINAHNGDVIACFNDIKKIAPPSADGAAAVITGEILAGEGGGVAAVDAWGENNGVYYLQNPNRRWFIYNVATSGWTDNNTYCHRFTADWEASDSVAMSAARNFDIVQRYYTEVHGRNSFNNSGIFARANIHEGDGYVNAYWNGSHFAFGDGDGADAGPLATLDICAHEFTHAVTEYTANLVYMDEPGALNESFSDIIGACVEFYAQADGRGSYPARTPGLSDWLMGEDAWLSSTALRDMRNPANVGTVGSFGVQPTRYKGSYWHTAASDNGGVHVNSGVQNFFFYLLSEGGSGNNDGVTYNVTGIGITNAGSIAYRALTVYCTASTDYEQVRSAWLSAALDLNPDWATNVAHAWSAVGVGALRVTPTGFISFRGPVGGPIEPQQQTISLVNRGSEPMSWTAAPAEPWLTLLPSSGVVPFGGSESVSVAVSPAVLGWPAGAYTNRITFTNNLEPATISRDIVLLIGQPEYFTEVFDSEPNDLAFTSFLFEPQVGDAYSICRSSVFSFPVDPSGGSPLGLTDDSSVQVALSGDNSIALYGRRTNMFFIGSNGYITFGDYDTAYRGLLSEHFALPRVAACFTDLDPQSGGTVSWKETAESAVITAENVQEFGSANTVSYQIEMFFDGRIRLTILNVSISQNVVGLSSGQGQPQLFFEYDLSATSECPPPDALVVLPPAGFFAEGYVGGPFAPVSGGWTLTNVSFEVLNWGAGANQNWLSVSPASGTLNPGEFATLTATLEGAATSLPAGVHVATVFITNQNSGLVSQRTASLTVKSLPPSPEPPFNPSPENNATNVLAGTALSWNAAGSDRRFFVFMGTEANSLSLVSESLAVPVFTPALLDFNTTYYWQVIVSNVVDTAAGPVWQFTTTSDEVHFEVAIQDVSESAGAASINITRQNPNAGAISVQFTAANGTAVAPDDFTTVTQTVSFDPGVMTVQVEVPIVNDGQAEANETIQLTLSQPSSGVRVRAPATATLVITDDDAVTASLPLTLFDGLGFLWDIQGGGYIDDGSNDAFDDAFLLRDFPEFPTAQTVGGREVIIGPAKFGDLDVSRRIYVPADGGFARFLEVIHNPTAGPITTNFWIDSNYGSDEYTYVVSTSNGDTTFTPSDNWVITDDGDGVEDPTILVVLANDFGVIRPASVYRNGDDLGYQFHLTIPPGETKIIMHFAAQCGDEASALDRSGGLLMPDSVALAQMSAADRARIVNFGIPTGVDRFVWSVIESPQQAGQPITVTIAAMASSGGLAFNFNGMGVVSARRDVAVFRADFESGNDGFTLTADSNSNSNLWHRTAHAAVSGAHSQYYGLEDVWNYSTGSRNAGNLESPAISLAGVPPPLYLSFQYLLGTEGATAFDQASILISTNNGAAWTMLASRTAQNPLENLENFAKWEYDLSEFAGASVRFRFNFDTIDGTQNLFEGWYVDDVYVRSAGTTLPVAQSIIGPFTNGVWSGTVAVLEGGTNIYLRCEDELGMNGGSGTFDVLAQPPVLSYRVLQGTGELELSWSAPGFRLQHQTRTLMQGLGSDWMDYPGGNSSPVIIPRDAAAQVRFFRLMR